MVLRVAFIVGLAVPSASFAQSTACSAGRQWTVQPASLTIGEIEGAPEYLFTRVSGAVTLRDSSIVIANSNPPMLRHYTNKGRFLFSFGRKGEGPGEFRSMTSFIRVTGDSLIVNDFMKRRSGISLFNRQGKYLLSFPLNLGRSSILRIHYLGGSRMVLVTDTPLRVGVGRDSLAVLVYDFTSKRTVRVGTFAGMDSHIEPTERGVKTTMIRYARGLTSAAGSGHIFLADTEKDQVQVFDSEGRLLRTFGSGKLGEPVTRDDKRVYLTRDPNVIFRTHKPFFGDFLVDVEGNLWAERYQRPNLHVPRTWDVHNLRGNRLCTAVTPPDHKLYEIGRDYILTVSTDEFGVERVVKLALRK